MKRALLTLGGIGLGAWALSRAVRSDWSFAGKSVLVTGGSRGLGLTIARQIAAEGGRLALLARDEDELQRACAELRALGGEAFAVPCDLLDRGQSLGAIESVVDRYGAIDVLINNAGIIEVGPLENMRRGDFEKAMGLHFWAPFNLIQQAIPHMRRAGGGRIVNISSIGGKVAVPHMGPYSMSKFALVGLSEAMRAELTGESIYVTTVVPGLIRTGSPRHAWFKGKVQAEYAWFSIGDSNSLSSISAESASDQIIAAFTRGDAEVVISPQAKLMSLLHGISPNLVQEMLSLVARVMPGATKSKSAVEGKDAESVFAPSPLTRNSDKAAARNNEN